MKNTFKVGDVVLNVGSTLYGRHNQIGVITRISKEEYDDVCTIWVKYDDGCEAGAPPYDYKLANDENKKSVEVPEGQNINNSQTEKIRTFETGATRDSDDRKLDFDGFLSPSVIKCYAQYMHQHRVQADGTLRSSDNWKLGIPIEQYMKSMWRHFFDVWSLHDKGDIKTEVAEEALCALLFNVSGMLHEVLKDEASRYIKPLSKETIEKCKNKVQKMKNKEE